MGALASTFNSNVSETCFRTSSPHFTALKNAVCEFRPKLCMLRIGPKIKLPMSLLSHRSLERLSFVGSFSFPGLMPRLGGRVTRQFAEEVGTPTAELRPGRVHKIHKSPLSRPRNLWECMAAPPQDVLACVQANDSCMFRSE